MGELFTLMSKWGCDGSSGYSTYKQKIGNPSDTDEFLFVFSFVRIKLHVGHNIIWQNPRSSSTMYFRPNPRQPTPKKKQHFKSFNTLNIQNFQTDNFIHPDCIARNTVRQGDFENIR